MLLHYKEVLDLGVYLTSAVKCGKTGYGIKAGTIKECSQILEREISVFPNLKVIIYGRGEAYPAFGQLDKL